MPARRSDQDKTLRRQPSRTSFDWQEILYSVDVALIFLDLDLNIRFFTPAMKRFFDVVPDDVGRPIANLLSLANDRYVLADVRTVLATRAPLEREVEPQTGAWYIRRALPYHANGNDIEGIVITFADITERRQATDALQAARQLARLANDAKSRFLAAAIHDLRQPLQTFALAQGLLAKIVEGDRARRLVARLEEALGAMSGMLNALIDINQIEAGNVPVEIITFPIDDLFARMKEEFADRAQSQGIALRVVSSSRSIHSDSALFEQVIRNLLSNALKYTKRGKVLLGCRRRNGALSIEVWDTGIGIPEGELQSIFEEYHRLDDAEREPSTGIGLGLAIVRSLVHLLGHQVHVRSTPGKGSVFSIECVPPPGSLASGLENLQHDQIHASGNDGRRGSLILVIEDDPEVRDILELLLKDEGHRVATAPDGVAALEAVTRGTVQPDLILADYNLPNGMNGLLVTQTLRDKTQRQIPVIILTGSVSAGPSRDIALQNCVQLGKPVKLVELTQAIQQLLPAWHSPAKLRAPLPAKPDLGSGPPVIFVVDDDSEIRDAMRNVFEEEGGAVQDYESCEAFLEAYHPGREACLLIDAYLPGMGGIELLQRLSDAGHRLPAIMITGNSDVPMAVQAMKAGALDFIEKPIGRVEPLASVARALEQSRDSSKLSAWRETAANHLAGLTSRQRQIMEMVLAGHPSKNIAADLGISQRTVENHRASIMKKTGSKSLPALARLALVAAGNGADGADEPPIQPGRPVASSRRLPGR